MIGNDKQRNEAQGEKHAKNCIDLQPKGGVFVALHLHESRSRGKAVPDGRTDGGHIHNPVKDGAPEPRAEQRNDHNENDGIHRGFVAGVQTAEPAGKNVILGHGIQKPAGGHVKADDPGQYRTEQRDPQNDKTGLS